MKKLTVTDNQRKFIEKAIATCSRRILEEMGLSEITHAKVSLDINRESTVEVIGVKYSLFRAEQAEFVYEVKP